MCFLLVVYINYFVIKFSFDILLMRVSPQITIRLHLFIVEYKFNVYFYKGLIQVWE